MSFNVEFDDQAWGVTSPPAGDIVKDALRKEKIIKYVLYH